MIRKLQPHDREIYLKFTHEFYKSEAVSHYIPIEFRQKTFDYLLTDQEMAECYIFEYENQPAGYALTAKTFSQEGGGFVLWIEELYVSPEFRNKGLGNEFFVFLKNEKEPEVSRLRLEIEPENAGAVRLYKKYGFDFLPYGQMIKELGMK